MPMIVGLMYPISANDDTAPITGTAG